MAVIRRIVFSLHAERSKAKLCILQLVVDEQVEYADAIAMLHW